MSQARVYAVRNRISEALFSKDGPTVESLVSDADARVALLSASIEAFVAGEVAVLAAFAEQPEEALLSGCQAIGEPAMNIAEVAEAAGMDAVGGVARGICVMLDGLVSRGIWRTDALRLHLRALTLVHGQSSQPAGLKIVEELRSLRSSLGFTD
ncbi:MAG: hypothetical protein Q8R45_10660 [Brevundimonas sp.]|uniref:hypothetical protein n=1 Tax=Brevundimonas sp. TaxID=1871086 RepID=UPI002734F322|nr:hypothetical protein [Brevundimonas sp.]MDP3370164.1 hypothetical protein [Brevundimonas sp.]MDP3657411.1 hypothetical protein [Brevundimonas sp.]MDZ4112271.1 hypothetical protein [Brevundimonas sp.]